MAEFDIAVIGGGINGVGIARDAAGRGLRVLLVEQNDLGSGTSSASSKLVHGGLRYLEHRAFRLVKEALAEREVLLRTAPHIVRPMRFILPPTPGPRSATLLRFGLFLYDRLGARKILPATKTIDLARNPVGDPLKRIYRFAFEYSDCWVDDSRLVVLSAIDAAERGASIRPRTRLVRADRGAQHWDLVLNQRGRRGTATASVLVNATGAWAPLMAETVLRQPLQQPMRLVKGSHIVVRRRFEHDRGYVFQTSDNRVVFALPFARDFTLIGTTDVNFLGDVNTPAPTGEEVIYLCNAVNVYLRDTVTPDEVIWSFAGVRSLLDDGHGKPEDVTRDYSLLLDAPDASAPLLTIYGGKITTFRRLAEEAIGKLQSFFPAASAAWTDRTPLPGGEFPHDQLDAVVSEMRQRWEFLTEPHARRLAQAYGLRASHILGEASAADDLGRMFTADLTEAEVRYLMREEWARSPDDVLLRRSKLGLSATAEERAALGAFMASEGGSAE